MHRLAFAAFISAAAVAGPATAATLDVSDPVAYEAAHRTLVSAFQAEMQSKRNGPSLARQLARHERELPLRELCEGCEGVARSAGVGEAFEPSVWLFQPEESVGGKGRAAPLVAFPPAGNDSQWKTVDAIDASGRWVTLDAHNPPKVPVIVVRINGELSFERQVDLANAALRQAGLQAKAPEAAATRGSGRWTTRLESVRLNDDEEPWISGAAEVYAVTAGVLPGNQPQVQIVDMPYLDHDGTTYYPRQVVLDWANYSYGAANILFYEHDDNTNYQQLVQVLIQAVGQGVSLAGYPVATAIAEIAARIVAAMPAHWFSNDDDYVDALYTVEKTRGETRSGASGNITVSYIPYELPVN
ncbi:DUF3103 domain-containing protein [Tahibacter amnicola]|uniref:DUF3103 domain-containing protein n=1 Tax=Tahibacter amnicola TaxID=2976241 RepID=A0ABY6BHF8_9GAMM|nr:DUF3103 domain-containing protein [Tahibacter amnicola]UXI68021.1 DUF3103 domain-containing protein [Tahibacter amnicola]